ncbi:MAG: hypothetical protein RL458_1951, partial [Pseudomonadota bacterium]
PTPQTFRYTVTEDDLLERNAKDEIVGPASTELALRQIAASIREAINEPEDESISMVVSAWYAGVPFDAQGKPKPGAVAPDLGTLIVLEALEEDTDGGFALSVREDSEEGEIIRLLATQTLPETIASDARASDNLSAGIASLVLEGSAAAIDDWLDRHAMLRHQHVPFNLFDPATRVDARLTVRVESAAAEAVAYATITASEGDSPEGQGIENLADDRADTIWLNETGEGAGFTVSLDKEEVLDGLRLTSVASDDIWQFDPATWEVYGSNEGEDWESDSWTLLGEGDTGLPDERGSTSEVRFANSLGYRYYKVVFPTTKDSFDGDNFVQLAEARLFAHAGPAWSIETSVHLDGNRDAPQGFSGGITPVVEALTSKFWIRANAPTNLVFSDVALGLAGPSTGQNNAAAQTLSVALDMPRDDDDLPVGAFAMRNVPADSGVTITERAGGITFTGTPAAIAALLTAPNRFFYTGALCDLSLKVTATATGAAFTSQIALVANQVIDYADRSVFNEAGEVLVDDNRAIEIATGTEQTLTFDFDGMRGPLLRASGGVELQLAGFVSAGGTMAIEKSSTTLTLADGSTAEADLLTIGGANLHLFVGANGPYRTDTNEDGVINVEDEVNTDALGVSAVGGEFGLVLGWERTLGDAGESGKVDLTAGRRWIALEANVAEAALVGVPSITAVGRDIEVAVNLVRDMPAGTLANTQVIDFSESPFTLYTGYRTTTELSLDGSRGESLRASGAFELEVGGFVQARGSLALEKSARRVALADGTRLTVDTLSLGGTGLSAFAGIGGGYFTDSNGDGLINASDTPNPDARGFVLQDAEFALALMTPSSDMSALFTPEAGAIGVYDFASLESVLANSIADGPALTRVAATGVVAQSPGGSPVGEGVANVIDGNTGTKYLNTAGRGSGFTLTLPQAQVLDSLALTTRTNDNTWQWDPKTWEVWGSNIDGAWNNPSWMRLGAGLTGLANERGASNVVTFNNTQPFKYYKVVFPTVKGFSGGRSYMHVSEARLFGPIEHQMSLADDAGVRAAGVITTASGPGNYLMLDRGANAEPLTDYTVMFDVQSPEDSRSLLRSLLQANGGNADDAELFIAAANDALGSPSGTDGLGFSTNPVDETRWARVVFVSNASAKRLYVDGDLVASASSTSARYTLGSKVLFFADNDGGNAPLNVGKLALWSRPLSGAEVATLGTAERLGLEAMADTRWTALEVSAGKVGFVGGDDLQITASGILVEVNQVSGLPGGMNSVDKVLDLATRPVSVFTGTGTSRVLDITGDRGELLRASGQVEIRVGGFLSTSGSLAFEKSTRVLTLDDGTRRAHDVLTVGAADLSAFAGINGGINPGPDATGFVLNDLDLALVIAAEREAVERAVGGPLSWTDVAIAGVRQVAVAGGAAGQVFVSDDRGVTWRNAGAPRGNYQAVSISDDGKMIAAVMAGGRVVVSTNGGLSWSFGSAASTPLTDVAMLSRDRIITSDLSEAVRFDVLDISGRFVPGDIIGLRVWGQAYETFQIRVPQRPLDAAPPAQAQLNESLAAMLRAQINTRSPFLRASGAGSQIILEARDGALGWVSIDPFTLQGDIDPVSKPTKVFFKTVWRTVNERRVHFGDFDRATLGNTEYAQLTGLFAEGDSIVVTGFASDPVIYEVKRSDLFVPAGKPGRFMPATPDQVRANVAFRLAELLRSQTTAYAVVGRSGPTLVFTGEAGRPTLQITVERATDAQGVARGTGGVEQASANTYREAAGRLQIGEPGDTATWVDAQVPRGSAQFTALDTFGAGQSIFAAAGD